MTEYQIVFGIKHKDAPDPKVQDYAREQVNVPTDDDAIVRAHRLASKANDNSSDLGVIFVRTIEVWEPRYRSVFPVE
jgi:hypothetical protein